MISEEYNMQVYNDYTDFPIVMTNIENFELEQLLSHPNPRVREFNFIIITKCTTVGKTTTILPIIVIYNRNDWDVKSEHVEDLYHHTSLKTSCSNRCQRLDFADNLKKFPCSNQNEIINRFNAISRKLLDKHKVKSLIKHK